MLSPNSSKPATTLPAADLQAFPQVDFQDIPPEIIPTLLTIQELFGAKLPADITYEAAKVPEAALGEMAFRTSYDEGYCGHFSIPGSTGAAANFAKVLAQNDPLAFIEQHLTFTPAEEPASGSDEWILFGPGLNTLHAVKPGWENETTTPQRLQEQYVRVLKTPMAQMHLGTDMDQGAALLPISGVLQALLEEHRVQLTAAGLMPQLQPGTASFDSRQRDRVEAFLSQQGFARPLFQQHTVQLLKLNETAQRSMVWMIYSRATGELSGALRQYIADYIARHPEQTADAARSEVESLLRRLVTVVSIGNSDRNWPDGPAYVHYSAMSDRAEGGTDPLTQQLGVHAKAPAGAGKEAVFIHVDGIFSDFDAHNFGAVGAASLKLVLDLNGCKTYRQLWEKGNAANPLKLPSKLQVEAKVVLTEGSKWIWDNNSAWTGVNLPTKEIAAQILAD